MSTVHRNSRRPLFRTHGHVVLIRLAPTSRSSSFTGSGKVGNQEETSSNNAQSIDALIDNLNTEVTKHSSKQKYSNFTRVLFPLLDDCSPLHRSQTSSVSKHPPKRPTVTKELEDLMESLSNFKLPSQVCPSLTASDRGVYSPSLHLVDIISTYSTPFIRLLRPAITDEIISHSSSISTVPFLSNADPRTGTRLSPLVALTAET